MVNLVGCETVSSAARTGRYTNGLCQAKIGMVIIHGRDGGVERSSYSQVPKIYSFPQSAILHPTVKTILKQLLKKILAVRPKLSKNSAEP